MGTVYQPCLHFYSPCNPHITQTYPLRKLPPLLAPQLKLPLTRLLSPPLRSNRKFRMYREPSPTARVLHLYINLHTYVYIYINLYGIYILHIRTLNAYVCRCVHRYVYDYVYEHEQARTHVRRYVDRQVSR